MVERSLRVVSRSSLTPFRTMAVSNLSYLNKLIVIFLFKFFNCVAGGWRDDKPDHARGWSGRQSSYTNGKDWGKTHLAYLM